MLLGQYEVNLTDRERLALPKKFREELGEKVILARWYEGCLIIASNTSWEELLKRLTSQTPYLIKSVRETDRFILGSAFEISLDRQGRFVVPKILREHAGIKNQVIFVGLGDRVEVWDLIVWKKKETEIQKQAEVLIEEVAKVNNENR